MWLPRFCVLCGNKLAEPMQASAFFCSNRCKLNWSRARERTRQSAELEELENKLKQCAQIAHWYRLAIKIAKIDWIYPAKDRPTLRFDGSHRQSRGFLLHPYEPPVVPIDGAYTIFLLNKLGQAVEIPDDDLLRMKVAACREMAVTEGERFYLSQGG